MDLSSSFWRLRCEWGENFNQQREKEKTVLKDLDPPSIPPTIPAHCATRKPFRFIEFIVTQKWAADNEKRMDTFIGSDEMENVSAAIGKTSVAIVRNFNCQEVAARNLFKYSNSVQFNFKFNLFIKFYTLQPED